MLDIFWHPDVLLHDTGSGVFEAPASSLLTVPEKHPEGPDRIRNMYSILKRGPLSSQIRWHSGRHAAEEELLYFHTPEYTARIKAIAQEKVRRLTSTTVLSPGSFASCCAAVGTSLAAMAFVLEAKNRLAFALVRPPGHHAAPDQADGYCIFNNVAIAAESALRCGVKRIAIVDWDVHHGNGTQQGFYERNDVLTISLHMDHGAWGPSHPQTGKADEIGLGMGKGFNLNIPLPMGTGDHGYIRAVTAVVMPAIESYRPEILIAACGQDASQFDPNGRQTVTMKGFHRMGAHMRELAEKFTDGRLLLIQEGGYAISYAAFCLHATLEGIVGTGPLLADPLAYLPDDPQSAQITVDKIRAFFKISADE